MLSEYRKLVYADDRYNNTLIVRLPEIQFTASGFCLKIFDRVCVFLSLFLYVFFFFFFWRVYIRDPVE